MSEKLLSVVLTISTAILFLSGYGYLQGYFQEYSINLVELGFGVHDILSHSWVVVGLMYIEYFWILVTTASVLVFLTIWSLAGNIASRTVLYVISAVFSFFALFSLIFSIQFGREAASFEGGKLPLVIWSNSFSEDLNKMLDGERRDFWLYHIASSNELTYILIKPSNAGASDRWIARIGKSGEIKLITYLDR